MPAGNNRVLFVALGVVLLITIGLLGTYYYLTNSQTTGPISDSLRRTLNLPEVQAPVESEEPPATPQPIKPLPGGVQTYNISHGAEVAGPKPFRAIINPLTPGTGENQTVQLAVTSDADITEAKIILHTDTDKKEYQLTLIEGNTQNGTWEASWTMEDTYEINYYIQFFLKSANGTFENGLRFRQSY